jgi:UDP-N-acetylmuramoyl-L-alanyl-D-glutamate--2,6-diaminopimelate ligase
MDFHGTFENYLYAKKKLFDILNKSAFGVYNSDDINSFDLVSDSRAKLFSYGMSSNADFILKDIKYDLKGTSFIVEHKTLEYSISTSLIGEFNAYNACAAFAVAVALGVEEKKALEGIKNTKQVPGRFEVLGKGDKKVIVDYSHTADSLEKALLAIKTITKDSVSIYTVFGCGGDRDRLKRPLMGKIASNLSKKVIITSDNPRFEDPYKIMEEIKSGIEKVNYETIENREAAISYAIANSEENAVILIAGKGHENYQEIKGIRNHFSDKEVAEKYLSTYRQNLN